MSQVQSREIQMITRSSFVTGEKVSKTMKQFRQLKKLRYKNVGWNFFQQSNWNRKKFWKKTEVRVLALNQVQCMDL